jgi:hypothetical protein
MEANFLKSYAYISFIGDYNEYKDKESVGCPVCPTS